LAGRGEGWDWPGFAGKTRPAGGGIGLPVAYGKAFWRLDRTAKTPGRLNADGIHKIVCELGRRCGLSRPLRPHGLRHHAITQVLDRSGGDLRAAARFSRHKDLRTLSIYDDNRKDLAGQMARLISED
jgi:integrase/recombinase XerC